MAFFGSNMPGDVGLRLLLCPLAGSNVVVRTACCSVGIVLPVYTTFRAIEGRDRDAQQRLLRYWAVYGSFSIAEVFTDKFISWFPLYYHVKFAFLVWLQLPPENGAGKLYRKFLRPFLLKYQAKLDRAVDFFYSSTAEFVRKHQAELQFVRAFVTKMLTSANGLFMDIIHPGQKQNGDVIEGQAEQVETSGSDNEE